MNSSIIALGLAVAASSAFFTASPSSQDAPAIEFPASSPVAKFSQRVGVTDIELTYGRPSARGRKIFGGLEPYGTVWRTGANGATQISFSTDVTFGGEPVPAGAYALLTIPGEKEWTVILSQDAGQYGTYSYDESKDQTRVKVTATALSSSVETLSIGLADLQTSSATLQIDWENTRVPVSIETDLVGVLQPQIEAAMASAQGGDAALPYFPAAMFYYENDLDLEKAAAWIDEAVKAQPNAFWISYRKGLILAKKGDTEGAREAATMSLELASKANGAVKDEYTRLNEALLARLK